MPTATCSTTYTTATPSIAYYPSITSSSTANVVSVTWTTANTTSIYSNLNYYQDPIQYQQQVYQNQAFCQDYPQAYAGWMNQQQHVLNPGLGATVRRFEDGPGLANAPHPIEVRYEKLKIAHTRARTLLLDILDEDQAKDVKSKGTFELRTNHHRYRIRPGEKVEELNAEGIVLTRFCIHPDWDLGCPPDDWAIAQKLLIESDEEYFRSKANKTYIHVA